MATRAFADCANGHRQGIVFEHDSDQAPGTTRATTDGAMFPIFIRGSFESEEQERQYAEVWSELMQLQDHRCGICGGMIAYWVAPPQEEGEL